MSNLPDAIILADIWDDVDPRNHPPRVEITCGDQYLTLDGYYHVAWERIDEPMKLVKWILHLSEKTRWIQPLDLRRIIMEVCERNDWDIPWTC